MAPSNKQLLACAAVAMTAFAIVTDGRVKKNHHAPRRYRRRLELEAGREDAERFLTNLRLGDGVRFKGYFRMSQPEFDHILKLVAPKIRRQAPFGEEPISERVQLAVALRFLATGESFRSLSHRFGVAHNVGCFCPRAVV